MDRHSTTWGSPPEKTGARTLVRLVMLLAALACLLSAAAPALAASPSPAPSVAPNADLRIEARALMGGHVRPGAWTAVDVLVTNDGPSVTGELLIRGPQQGQSRYGVDADLPSPSRQRFTLYAQTALFGSRVNIDLVSNDQVIATQQVKITSHDAYSPIVAVIAEQPAGLLRSVTAAMTNPNVATATVITLSLPDLPERVEAWSAIDRLVWQDVDASQLTDAQLEALRLWIGAGGRLVILGGTTDPGFISAFNRGEEKLLPYDPAHTIDAQPADLAPLLGSVPATATTVPALAGALDHGTALARVGNDVIAADASYGRGTVTLLGFNPAEQWIADSDGSEGLWHRLLPQSSTQALNPLAITDDSQIVYALQNLPSVDLPPIEQLFVLLVAYIALIGPVNYLVLRRLDKREWAWVTIPALVVVFAVGSYGLGATLKGSDVIVNQITVVRAAQGTGRGIGQAYIGIYSPSRRTFDVRIPGGALLSNPSSQAQSGQAETPLDVVFGQSSSRLRNFEVGFGVLRGFRAEAPADSPRVDADLVLKNGRLQGTVTNRSDTTLENVAVLFSGGAAVLPTLDAGQSKEIDLDVTSNAFMNFGLSDMIFGSTFPRDSAQARTVTTRRAVIDQLFPWGSLGSTDSPLLLAWRKGPVLDVDLAGDTPNRVGEGLFMIPLGVTLDAQQVFGDQMMRRTIVGTTATNGWGDVSGMYLSRGTMTVETRPSRFDGAFHVASLEIAITQGDTRVLGGNGTELQPLPADQQPDQDDPVDGVQPQPSPAPGATATPEPSVDPNGSGNGDPQPPCCKPGAPPPIDGQFDNLPDFQLFDRTSQKWVEFPHPNMALSYLIPDPERYVDEGGAVLFRFINRSDAGQFGEDQFYFQLLMRLDGTIG
jgi:hypothetical protein